MLRTLILLSLLIRIHAAETPPNVVFIVSDDQAWQDYGFMGHERIDTPRLDRLAARSLTFTRGTTHVPLCRPSLATILTGLHPHQHGVTGNDPDLPDARVNPMAARGDKRFSSHYEAIIRRFSSRPNLVRDLSTHGYRSLQTGKWWEGDPVVEAGFTDAMTRGGGKAGRHGDAGLKIGRDGLGPIREFLDATGDRPFFIWYAPLLPHAPHNPPQDLLDKYLPIAPSAPIARYWACVEWFDRTCGELIDELESRELLANTILVYICDNGWLQSPDEPNRFAARSKLTPYEGGVRTPIMISWPGRITPRIDRTSLAGSIDLWPTVAALAGRPAPDGLPGINLTDPAAVSKRTRVFGAAYTHNIADIEDPSRSLTARYVIHGWNKLIVPTGEKPPELYNLESDPWETRNLAAEQPGVVNRLRAELDTWWTP